MGINKLPSKFIRTVVLLSTIGLIIEAYDFFSIGIISTAIWPYVFFKGASSAAIAFSIFAYATILIGRPVGGALFGHFGDKIGRKFSMFWSLFLSGIAMLLVALMPPLGILAIILIASLRFIQGLGLGGDGGSSLALSFEYANKGEKPGYFMSFPMAAAIIGILLGLVGVILSENVESKLFLLSYGWRILIGVGAIALIVSAYLRMRIVESFDFKELVKEGKVDSSPIKSVFKVYWKKILLLTLAMAYFPVMLNFVLYPYSIELYEKLGFAEKQVMLLFLIASVVATAFTLLGGYLSDKYNWKKVVLISALGSGVSLPLLLLHSFIGLIALYLLSTLGWGAMGMYASEFVVKLRNTGSGLVFGLIGIFPAVMLIAVLPALIALYGVVGSLTPTIGISEAITLVSIASVILLMRRNEGGIS
ncbi:MFS transporter [Acidianus sp. HS-5]|uniref:MFS transporter n=1 Tax=Acidianus sp. HS-5 TaxID=2886040 RepID=UPI001F029A4D|nr:MFS transporter [Acidianus sp. HS-5]BDC17521.1 MFS transporter [Acidianus sp. HS-5]